jgi:hypothetical protein
LQFNKNRRIGKPKWRNVSSPSGGAFYTRFRT